MSHYDDDLRTRAAWLYYKEGLTQDQVAQILGINRTRVLRMLATARSDGTVQIRVASQLSHCIELERELEQKFELERAIIVPTPQEVSQTPAVIGSVLGEYLSDTFTESFTENSTVGLGWGKTLSSALISIPQFEKGPSSVVSLLGGLTKVSAFNPSEFAWRVGDRLGAECFLIAAPVFAPDKETCNALLNHPGIREVFERSLQLDYAIVSVGDLSPMSTFIKYGLLDREEIISLEKAGAVGDVLCRFVNAEGEVIDHPVNDRVIAIDPRSLRSARKVILASGGWHKLAIMRAAMKTLQPKVLITDAIVAERLID